MEARGGGGTSPARGGGGTVVARGGGGTVVARGGGGTLEARGGGGFPLCGCLVGIAPSGAVKGELDRSFDKAAERQFPTDGQLLGYALAVTALAFFRRIFSNNFGVPAPLPRLVIPEAIKRVFAKMQAVVAQRSFSFLIGLTERVLLIPALKILGKAFKAANGYRLCGFY